MFVDELALQQETIASQKCLKQRLQIIILLNFSKTFFLEFSSWSKFKDLHGFRKNRVDHVPTRLDYLDLYPLINPSFFFWNEFTQLSRESRKIQIGDGHRLITAELNGECRFGNWISYRARAEWRCRYLTCLRAINVLIGDKGSPCSPWHPPRWHDLYTYGLCRRCIHYLITHRQVNTDPITDFKISLTKNIHIYHSYSHAFSDMSL